MELPFVDFRHRTHWPPPATPSDETQQRKRTAAFAKGVRTHTRARLGPQMVSEYVSYRPPTSVGMTMVKGPWFFDTFGGGWRFVAESRGGVDGTLAVWKYTYSVRPTWLRFVAEPIGQWLLGREIEARIEAWSAACVDPEIIEEISTHP